VGRLVERQEAEAEARLQALREAARIGVADIEAERYLRFDSSTELARHLADVIEAAIKIPIKKTSQ